MAVEFEIAINRLWPGQKLPDGDSRWARFNASFKKERHTIETLTRRIAVEGCAISAVMRGAYRKTENFVSAQHLALDCDQGTAASSIDVLIADPFIASHAAIVHETVSSKPNNPRSRVVFILDGPINDRDQYREAAEALIHKFQGVDERAKDAARFFYGRKNGRCVILGNVLYRDVLQQEVIEPYLRARQEQGHRKSAKPLPDVMHEKSRNINLASLAGSMRNRGARKKQSWRLFGWRTSPGATLLFRTRKSKASRTVFHDTLQAPRSIAMGEKARRRWGWAEPPGHLKRPSLRMPTRTLCGASPRRPGGYGMEHKFIQGGHEWLLDNGATLRAVDVARSRSGRIYGNLKVLANADTPEETILGGGVVDLSDAQARYRLAVALSKQNGAAPDPWADTLLAVWYALDEGLNAQNETFSPVDLAEFDEPLPPQYTVEQLLPSGKPSEGYGDNGAGKSTSFDYLGLRVVTGKPFLGYNVIRGPVLKLDFELDREITLWRCYQLARGMGLKRIPEDFYYQNLASPLLDHLDAFTQWCVNLSPALVEIDSLGPAMAEDPLAHKLVIQFMNNLRATGRTILVIDHQSKPQEGQSYQGKRSMGSGYKGHLVRSSLQIEMTTSAPGKASLILRQHKNSFGPKADPIPYHIIFEKQAIRLEKGKWDEPEFLESSMMTSDQKIERYLREHDFGTKSEILEATGLNEKTFDNAISKLRKRGVVPREAGRDGLNRVYNLA